MNEDTWPAVGDVAVLYTPGRFSNPSIKSVTVERLTKTRVVLGDGSWIDRKTLTKRNGAWDPNTLLLRPDDERVAKARREILRDRARYAVIVAYEKWDRQRHDVDAEGTALDALRDLRDAVDAAIEVLS